MASFANYFTILFLSIMFMSCVSHTQARIEWRFFRKVSKPKVPSVKAPAQAPMSSISAVPGGAPTQAPISSVSNAPTPAPSPAEPMSENNYGLYGFGNDQFPPAKEVNTAANSALTNMEDELLEQDDQSFEEMDNFNQDNNGYTDNYDNNGYSGNYYNTNKNKNPEKYNNGYARNYNKNGYGANKKDGYVTYSRNNDYETNMNNGYVANNMDNGHNKNGYVANNMDNGYNKNGYVANNMDNGYNKNGYVANNMDNGYNNNGYVANNRNNGYEDERQGMSDTRFMENGKYYYDVKNENNFVGGYENTQKNRNNENEEKDEKSPYEFDTMEEYEQQGKNNEHVGVYWP